MSSINILGKTYTVTQADPDEDGLPVYLVQLEKLSYFTARHHRNKNLMFLASSKNMNTYEIWLTDRSGNLEYVEGKWG